MFCGFGAVVLLVLIINAHIIKDANNKNKFLQAEIERVHSEIEITDQHYLNLKNSLHNKQKKKIEIEKKSVTINNRLAGIEKENQKNTIQKQRLKSEINKQQSSLKEIEQSRQSLLKIKPSSGNKIRQYEGDGHRQYLTGLKLGGKRVLFLIDNSASMLDDTIVNIIIKRNLSDTIKKSAYKWLQAVKSVKWMVANLPKNSQFLIISFNEKITSLADHQLFRWIKTSDSLQIDSMFKQLMQLVPEKGTNLEKAFTSITQLSQQPDNIILITDGLPTQSNEKGNRKNNLSKISPSDRELLFKKAIKIIPPGIPVNTILLPMEGDPRAAVLFWKLAIDTNGSFMTPSRDWP